MRSNVKKWLWQNKEILVSQLRGIRCSVDSRRSIDGVGLLGTFSNDPFDDQSQDKQNCKNDESQSNDCSDELVHLLIGLFVVIGGGREVGDRRRVVGAAIGTVKMSRDSGVVKARKIN